MQRMPIPVFWLLVTVLIGYTWSQHAAAISLQITDPVSQQLLATEAVSGQISFGPVSVLGLQSGVHPRIDGIYPLNEQGLMLAPEQWGIPPAMLYILGVSPHQGAVQLTVTDLAEAPAEVFASYTGDLELYLSEAQAPWQPGTQLNGGQHVLIPNDNQLVPLVGIGGRISGEPLLGSTPLHLDMALKIKVDEPAGPKSGVLTLTVIGS